MNKLHTYKKGSLCVTRDFSGLQSSTYTGVIDVDTALVLATESASAVDRSRAVLIDLRDSEINLLDIPPIEDQFRKGSPAGAFVVRGDQMAVVALFAERMANCGILRSCWLPHQWQDAKEWVMRHALKR